MTRKTIRTLCDYLKCAAIFAALVVCAPAMADDVTITSEGGALVLTGRVIGYDGQFLQLQTDHGALTLDYAAVTCAGDDCPDAAGYVPTLRVSGSARMADVLMPALVDAFARSLGGSSLTETVDVGRFAVTATDSDGVVAGRFVFHATTTDEGFADMIAHEADIVMALREVRPDEVVRAQEAGVGRLNTPEQSRIIGIDALVPVTASGQGISEISIAHLAQAFRGGLTNWNEIGGPDLPISLHLGPVDDALMQGFVDRVVQRRRLSADVMRHPDLATLRDALAGVPGALGVLPYRDTGLTQALSLRDSCGFVARPVLTTLKTEDYPLTAPLFVYLPNRRLPAIAGQFLAFLRTPQAQLVVRRAGYVDQGAIPIPLDAQGQRFVNAIRVAGEDMPLTELQRMVRVLSPRTRMSTSFRFEVGSTRLDAQSRSNLLNLGQAIRDGGYAGQVLLLVGFSDGRGAADANRDLSSARSEAVKRDLLSVLGDLPGDVVIETEAFGEALPMGCDDTELGRQMNRRVELWVTANPAP